MTASFSASTLPRTLLAIALVATLAACGSARTSTGGGGGSAREQGEARLNAWIGRSIANTFLDTDPLIQKQDVDRARQQYVMPDQSGCTIGFIVNRQTKILMSWSYLRDKDRCWASGSSSFN